MNRLAHLVNSNDPESTEYSILSRLALDFIAAYESRERLETSEASWMSDKYSVLREDTQEFNVVFIHCQLDEAGLTAAEFRVYCHLARRGVCFAAIGSIAKVCLLHEKTVRKCLKHLEELKMLLRKDRPGETTTFTLTKPSVWTPPKKITPPKGIQGTPTKRIPPPLPKGASLSISPEVNPREGERVSLLLLKTWFLEKTEFPIDYEDRDLKPWVDQWLERYQIKDLEAAFRFISEQIRIGKREHSALAPRNFFRRFSETLTLARKAGFGRKRVQQVPAVLKPCAPPADPPEVIAANYKALWAALS